MTRPEDNRAFIARIVSAYASRSDVTADDIVGLVVKLKHEMGNVPVPARIADDTGVQMEEATGTTSGTAEPALPISQAVTRDRVHCLCCGKSFKMLKRHLGAEHGLTEAEYRARFGLSEDTPLVAPSYSERKADYAKQAGFGKYRRESGASDARQEENIS